METSSRKKRTHLSSNQVSILEASFVENSHPDSSIRNALAQELSVTGRTVQIWFQNRRAKEKKAMLPKEHTQRYQPTFRSMMTPEAFEAPVFRNRPRSISKPEPKSFQLISDLEVQQQHQRALSEGLAQASLGPLDSAPIEIIPLQPNVLRIGTWTRFNSEPGHEWDLSCEFNLPEKSFIWKVRVGEYQFKMNIAFKQIQYIELQSTGQLDIYISPSLSFSMLRFNQDIDWIPCGDFTEGQQASISPVHSLEGDYELLKHVLLDVMLLSPELSTKIISPGLEVCRDYTLSPSATPEPFMMQYTTNTKSSPINNDSHLMLQAPFFYPTVSPTEIEPDPSSYNNLYNTFVSF